jgi:hypothetical protein
MKIFAAYLKHYISIIAGISAAIIYGAITYLIFREGHRSDLSAFSFGFFICVPPILGFLTVIFATNEQKSSWRFTLSGPWLSCLICIFLAGLFNCETKSRL